MSRSTKTNSIALNNSDNLGLTTRYNSFTSINSILNNKNLDLRGAQIFEYNVKNDAAEKTNSNPFNGGFLISKWRLFILANVVVLLAIAFVGAILGVALTNKKYGESCGIQKCEPTQNTTCMYIESEYLCSCDVTKYWNGSKSMCLYRSIRGELCTTDDQCRPDYSLECMSNLCDCNSSKYWNGQKCVLRATFNETCNSTSSCQTQTGLSCNTSTGYYICDCLPTANLYWNGVNCSIRGVYGSSCQANSWCNQAANNLICVQTSNTSATPTCGCASTDYYDATANACKSKLAYGVPCTANIQCDDSLGLQCLSTICDCPSNQYFYGGTCVTKRSYNSVGCTATHPKCDDTVGLTCTAGTCVCLSASKFWSNIYQNCITKLALGSSCTWSSECSSGGQCLTLPSTGDNVCQCNNVTQFFDTNSATPTCVSKYLHSVVCNSDLQCDQNRVLDCISGVCNCTNDRYYWHTTNRMCYLKSGFLTACSTSTTCNNTFVCTNSRCICPAQYAWRATINQCVYCGAAASGFYGYDDRCYELYATSSNDWNTSVSLCNATNKWLFQPSTQREYNYLRTNFKIYDLWMGGYRDCNNCTWLAANTLDGLYFPSTPFDCCNNDFLLWSSTTNPYISESATVTYGYMCEKIP